MWPSYALVALTEATLKAPGSTAPNSLSARARAQAGNAGDVVSLFSGAISDQRPDGAFIPGIF